MRHNRGFTLLEVLVALAVLALALGAGIKAAGSNVENTAYLRDRTFAHWVAMNKLAEMETMHKFPSPGTTERGTMLMAEHEWHWTVQTTLVRDLEPYQFGTANIEVRRNEDDKSTLATLTAAYNVARPGP
jgi:general secretion pathway protein I